MKTIPVLNPARPPLSSTRVMIFDTLEHMHEIKNVADICCGSGSMGLEAISRGAEFCIFIDNNIPIIRNVCSTIKEWGVNATGLVSNAEKIDKNIVKVKVNVPKIDTVFIDLPFKNEKTNSVLESIKNSEMCSNDCVYVIRSHKKHDFNHESFEAVKEKRKGISKIIILKLKQDL